MLVTVQSTRRVREDPLPQSGPIARTTIMATHKPPKQQKKKPQHSPKEKKTIKQQKKHQGDPVPLIVH